MSDTASSGATATEPAATPHAAPSGESTSNFTFGTSRGSGLARGKRNSNAASAAAGSPAKEGYQPTAIEVITPKSEYSNPFATEPSVEPVAEPAAPAPAEVSAKVETHASMIEKAAVSAATPANIQAVESRAELNILPPAETKIATQSWESPRHDHESRRHDERPTFRPERRERRERNDRAESSAPRERQERREYQERREHREYSPAPRAVESKPTKSGGFLGWLKSLFGGSSAVPAQAEATSHEPRQHRRRHRGGRGRQNFNGGEHREHGGHQGGEQREHGHGGDRSRRRRRGGRNRHDDRGPRSEGQQGGGVI
ncbi:MAG: hypothetical protein IT582_07190 [Opitutaceae bacterium]|nr:hypothetical protein [Opitutaceae bacterium]